MSNQVEIIYSSSRNSKEAGEIFRISPRKSARGIRPLRGEEELTLVKTLKICRADEQSNEQLNAMNGENEVHTIKKQTAWKAGKDQNKTDSKRKNSAKRDDKQQEFK